MNWSGKRYHSLNHHLREKFGEKVMKISLDAGFTCPNRDGTVSRTGCIFCSERGSGDFAGERLLPIGEQFCQIRDVMDKKWKSGKYIAYFQAFTNTYDTVENLKKKYDQGIAQPGVVGLAIATRPDCLDEEKVRLLAEYARDCYVWVELGLQTASDETARRINRGYDRVVYEEALALLKQYGIETVTHVIFGLPGETPADMLDTVRYVTDRGSDGVKFHLLYLVEHTPMVKLYEEGLLTFLTREEYIELIVQAVGLLDPRMVVHRFTGDSPRQLLIGPKWSLRKWEILNDIDRTLEERNISQGSLRRGKAL